MCRQAMVCRTSDSRRGGARALAAAAVTPTASFQLFLRVSFASPSRLHYTRQPPYTPAHLWAPMSFPPIQHKK